MANGNRPVKLPLTSTVGGIRSLRTDISTIDVVSGTGNVNFIINIVQEQDPTFADGEVRTRNVEVTDLERSVWALLKVDIPKAAITLDLADTGRR